MFLNFSCCFLICVNPPCFLEFTWLASLLGSSSASIRQSCLYRLLVIVHPWKLHFMCNSGALIPLKQILDRLLFSLSTKELWRPYPTLRSHNVGLLTLLLAAMRLMFIDRYPCSDAWLNSIMWQIYFQSNLNLFSAGSSVQTLIQGMIICMWSINACTEIHWLIIHISWEW